MKETSKLREPSRRLERPSSAWQVGPVTEPLLTAQSGLGPQAQLTHPETTMPELWNSLTGANNETGRKTQVLPV